VVERAIVQMLTEKTVELGDPTPIRDFLFVDDHVKSYISCIGNPKTIGEVFNFCTGIGTSIKQLIDLLTQLVSFKGKILWNTIPSRPIDIKELVGDYNKAKHLLSWKPKFTLNEGLESTIDFWKNKLKMESASC